jgi:hypothetical protein
MVAALWALLFGYVIVNSAVRGQLSWWTPLVVFVALYVATC